MEDHTVSQEPALSTCAATLKSAAPRLSDDERRVLRYLVSVEEDYCVPFAPICRGTKLNRPRVRLACRSLTRKGLARFARGLWHEYDGTPAGSGYGHTRAGFNLIRPPRVAREHPSPQPHPPQSPGDKARDDHNPKADGEQA